MNILIILGSILLALIILKIMVAGTICLVGIVASYKAHKELQDEFEEMESRNIMHDRN